MLVESVWVKLIEVIIAKLKKVISSSCGEIHVLD